jgi:acetyl esterase/lipase
MFKAVTTAAILAAATGLALAAGPADDPNLSAGDRIIRQFLPGCGPTIALWPGKAPDEPENKTIPAESYTGADEKSVLRIQNVSRPTITVSRPTKVLAGGANGASAPAVIVCPGGGYGILAARKEGTEIVQWLNSLGITGVLLKYRVPRREKGDAEKHRHALQDAQRAMGLVRLHAKDWGIDPNRVGILGFSAGGHLGATACNNYGKRAYEAVDEADGLSCRPDFAVLIYPAYLKVGMGYNDLDKIDPLQHAEAMSARTTPPTFIAVSEADGHAGSGVAYFTALARAKVPAALHVYPGGGHGTGMQVYPLSRWGDEAAQWMRDLKIIPAAETPAVKAPAK